MPRSLDVSSSLKPFITDITIIIAATPIIIPITEKQEKTDIYPSVFFEKRNLLTNKRS